MTGLGKVDPGAGLVAFFGTELRRLRNAAGMSQAECGQRLNYSGSMVAAIESGDRVASVEFAKACDVLFGTNEFFERLCAAIRKQARAYPSWFWDFVDKEREATVIKEFEALAIPGLFQTEGYARGLFRACKLGVDDEEISKHVTGRLERQQILGRPKPPMIWAVLDEAVIRRPVGGLQVMDDQLAHLVELAGRPRVVLQIMPFAAGGHAGLMGAFMLLTLGSGHEVAYTESAGSSQLIERPEDAEPFALAFDALRAQALSPDASIDLIAQVVKDITS